MRWDGQLIDEQADEPQQSLLGIPGLIRSVRTPDFSGVVFHEVRARSILNRVPDRSAMPFRWTINPYRGCSHGCTYCFARRSHTYLDFDSGRDFDTQIVVKVNAGEVLERQLRAPSWQQEHVALGTNTDPYQRAEGKYQLMPGIIRALAGSGTSLSILTKGTVMSRDLPLLRSAATEVRIGLGVSIALVDRELQQRLEPGTPSPQARLELVRKATEAGLSCGVFLAPVLPGLTDSVESLEGTIAAVADAGASGVTVIPLHLRPGAREWFAAWLEREHPELVPTYRRLYRHGSNADRDYRRWLSARVAPLVRKYGLEPGTGTRDAGETEGTGRTDGSDGTDGTEGRGGEQTEGQGSWPAGSIPSQSDRASGVRPTGDGQLSLL